MKEQLEDEIYEELIVHQVQRRFEETNVMDQEVESSHDVEFTWSNGRRWNIHKDRRLDRSMCDQLWLNLCCSLSC